MGGQSLYCAPTIYKNKDFYAIDPAGRHQEFIARSPGEMTRLYGAGWRDWNPTDPPRYMIWQGTTKVILAPAPSVSRAATLIFEGFATTTSKVTGSTMHLWPLPGDDCPLPEDGQMALVYRVCQLRCVPYVGKIPEAAAKMQVFANLYRQERNDLEKNSATRFPKGRLGWAGRRFVARVL